MVRNEQVAGLPAQEGDGLVMIGQAGQGVHLAWMPLEPGRPPDQRSIRDLDRKDGSIRAPVSARGEAGSSQTVLDQTLLDESFPRTHRREWGLDLALSESLRAEG